MTLRIDATDKPTLRYRHGKIEPMAEHDRIFAERHTAQRPSWLDRWRR
jgi:hypothetical protein